MKQIDHYQVLLVDDEHFLRQSLRRRLETGADDFRIVAEASDGQEALEALRQHTVQVVITDIRMPVMDGLTLVSRIRELYPDILVVILSGYAEFEYARTAIRYGVTNYLLKPVSEEDLENTLSELRTRLQTMYELPDENSASRLGSEESVRKAIRYMQEHYMEEIDIGAMAENLGFHASYLSRLFNRHVGESPLKYLTGIRIEEAKKLLRDTSLSIADVGERVGYPDQFHFSRTFRKATGVSPSVFRHEASDS